jgi:hypothetical protein
MVPCPGRGAAFFTMHRKAGIHRDIRVAIVGTA